MKTIYRLLKYNRMLKSHRIKYAGVLLADMLHMRHLSVRIDPVLACNVRCRMCYFSNEKWRKENKGIMDEGKIDRVAEVLFPKALQLVIGCVAEPTLYKDFTAILKLGRDHHVPYISLVSNGQLLTDEHIETFISYKLSELMLSTHGVTKDTYEYMMPGASYDKFISLLRSLKAIKLRRKSSFPALRINYTVNPDNIAELRNFFDVYGEFDVQALQIRPIIDLGDTAYTNKDMSNHVSKYNDIIKKLAEECRKRKIIFMANVADPTYASDNPAACLYQELLRYVSPNRVWRPDFAWEVESYRDYCKRTGWRSHLLRSIFSSAENFSKNRRTMTYDVRL